MFDQLSKGGARVPVGSAANENKKRHISYTVQYTVLKNIHHTTLTRTHTYMTSFRRAARVCRSAVLRMKTKSVIYHNRTVN